jgi:Vacuolar sorting-associated protein 13, N-terminal
LGHWHGYFYEGDGIRETSGTDTMMTFVLEPAPSEQEFKADAWSNRGRYTISGCWSKNKDDVMQIKFKMSFSSEFWPDIFFNGRYDPDRDALTGVWAYSADLDNTVDKMEFRRMHPRYLTVYPSIKELSDNKARALWRFAIAAVRNDIRRDCWSWSHFSQRRDDRKTVISLSLRYHYFGTPLDYEEMQWTCAAAQRLTPADACFYGSQINRIRAYTWAHKFVLDRVLAEFRR